MVHCQSYLLFIKEPLSKKSSARKMAQGTCIPLLNPKSINGTPKIDDQTLFLKHRFNVGLV